MYSTVVYSNHRGLLFHELWNTSQLLQSFFPIKHLKWKHNQRKERDVEDNQRNNEPKEVSSQMAVHVQKE